MRSFQPFAAIKRPLSSGPYRYLTLTILVILLALGNGLTFSADNRSSVSDEKETRLDALRQQIKKLRESLGTARTRKDTLQRQLRTTELEIGKLSLSLKNLDDQITLQGEKLQELHLQKTQHQEHLDQQRQSLARQIRAGYAMGKQGQLKIFLNLQDPAVVGRTLTYYDYFNRARATRIDNITAILEELGNLEEAIDQETLQLAQIRDEQTNKLQSLEDNRLSRKKIIAKLDTQIVTSEQRLKQLLQDEVGLVKLLEGIRSAISSIPPDKGNIRPFAALKGSLSWPSDGRISARYGTPRNIGKLKWDGVMISAAEGKDVKAIYHGRVAFSDWLRGYGLLLIIDHGNGYMSLYGYNQSLYKSVGDWVEAGERIATVGNSGGNTSAGLYFEIRHNGAPVNPVLWCKTAKK